MEIKNTPSSEILANNCILNLQKNKIEMTGLALAANEQICFL